MRSPVCRIFAVGFGVALTPGLVSAQPTFDTVVLRGDAAEVVGPGVTFMGSTGSTGFSFPSLNNAGAASFSAILSGPGVAVANNQAVFTTAGGGYNLIGRKGDAAPGTGAGVTIASFATIPAIGSAGQVGVTARFTGTGIDTSNDRGWFAQTGGSLQLIAREGDAAPGTAAGVNFKSLLATQFNNAGQTAFRGQVIGTGVDNSNTNAVFSNAGGSLQIIARDGDAAPLFGPGVNYNLVLNPVLNNAGDAAFHGFITGTGVNAANQEVIFAQNNGTLQAVVRSGDLAPGLGLNVNFKNLRDPVLNDAGQIAFQAEIIGTGVTSSNDEAIFSQGGGSLSLVARVGGSAPGTGLGVFYNKLYGPILNNEGQTVFVADLQGIGIDSANDRGLYFDTGSGVELLAHEGSAAPGTGPGVVFEANNGISSFNLPALNNLGQIAFLGALDGTGVTSSNDAALFATDPDGVLQLIVREGDLFDVNDDPAVEDLRTIANIGFATGDGTGGSLAKGLNDARQLAFRLSFAGSNGGEGIFRASFPGGLDGDYNADGFVSQADLDLVLLNWGQSVIPAEWIAADQFDGVQVSQNELDGVLLNWGNGTPPSATAIPEPTALTLLGLGSAALLRRHR